jgi:hypothetical protein
LNTNKIFTAKGGIMKRIVIAVAAALPLVFAVPAFATDASQPSKETGTNFEQMQADHLKMLDERLNSLQQEKACVQAAKNQDNLRACRAKHKAEMKEHRDEMRKMMGPFGPGGQAPSQGK